MAMTIGELIASTHKLESERTSKTKVSKRIDNPVTVVNRNIGIFKPANYKASDKNSMSRRVVLFTYLVNSHENRAPDPSWKRGAPNIRGMSGGDYRVFIFVPQVNVRTAKTSGRSAQIGKGKFMKPIEITQTKVKVRCDCADFRWRFAFYNAKHKALYGAMPPPYTAKGNRPPVNPNERPGVCKHIMTVFSFMKREGLIL